MMTLLLQLPHTTEALSTTPIVTSGVESTARKRIGKKSFINKQSINKLPIIYTPEELHNLGVSFSKRQIGSKSYYRGWFNWKTAAIDAIRNELSINNLPYPADRTKFENLFFRLGEYHPKMALPSSVFEWDEEGKRTLKSLPHVFQFALAMPTLFVPVPHGRRVEKDDPTFTTLTIARRDGSSDAYTSYYRFAVVQFTRLKSLYYLLLPLPPQYPLEFYRLLLLLRLPRNFIKDRIDTLNLIHLSLLMPGIRNGIFPRFLALLFFRTRA